LTNCKIFLLLFPSTYKKAVLSQRLPHNAPYLYNKKIPK